MSEQRNDLMKRAGTYVFSTALGAAAAVLLLLFFAFIMYTLQFPLDISGIFALFSLGVGCMLSGYVCGRIKKHSGLRHGFRCAVILLSLCLLGALLFGEVQGTDSIAKVLTAVFTGCTGGVLGVNRR